MSLIEPIDLQTAEAVFANRKRVKDYFASLKSPDHRQEIARLVNELASVKAERDRYRAVANQLTDGSKDGLSVGKIQSEVCLYYEVGKDDLTHDRRGVIIVQARHVAMFLAKILTTTTITMIGRLFGDRDHSTVIHAIHKLEKRRETDEQLDLDIKTLIGRLQAA